MVCGRPSRLPRPFHSLSLSRFRTNSGSLAIFAAILRASSLESIRRDKAQTVVRYLGYRIVPRPQ
jgi:hypothetical protein